MNGQIIEAVYTPDILGSKNPLIEALPPQLSIEDLYSAMVQEVHLPEGYEEYTPNERQLLCGKMKELYIPMEYTASIYYSLYHGLRTAYAGRTAVTITRRMTQIGKAIEEKGVSLITDSEIQAESFSVLGEPGMGKSTTLKKLLHLLPNGIVHTEYKGQRFQVLQIPYLYIECPANHSLKNVCVQIIEKMDEMVGTNLSKEIEKKIPGIDLLVMKIAQLCTRYCVGAIIIDEIQNVMLRREQEKTTGSLLIKFLVELSNKTGVCLVCVGTTEVAATFNKEQHLARRTRGPRIPTLSYGKTYVSVLNQMWSLLALKNRGPLTEEIKRNVYELTEGSLGRMQKLLWHAACEAIVFGGEQLTPASLRSVAKKYEISGKKGIIEPQDIALMQSGIQLTETIVGEAKKSRGRPKTDRCVCDLVMVYEMCKEYGTSVVGRLSQLDLLYGGKCWDGL